MLFDYIYLLKNYNAAFFDNDNVKCSEFIIPLNDEVIGKKPELFIQMHNSKHKFCFLINADLVRYNNKFIKEEVVQNIVRLLFLPNYLRVAGKYLFFVEKQKQDNSKIDSIKEEFINELNKQGVNEIIFENINTNFSAENISEENNISISNTAFSNYFKKTASPTDFEKFTIPSYFYKKWIINIELPDDLLHTTKSIGHFESWLKIKEPLKVKLIEMYSLAQQDADNLKLENGLLKSKLQNSSYYLKLIRQDSQHYMREHSRLSYEIQNFTNQPAQSVQVNNQDNYSYNIADNHNHIMHLQSQIEAAKTHANVILEWYKKEYEILPLWYKRFGHIIKAIMGKRTFKSLFK